MIDVGHISRQREWSTRTFGPGSRTRGITNHIREELVEIEADPTDLVEWVDVIILAIDGAWRSGHEPQEILDALKAKQAVNEARDWPDWRGLTQDDPINHLTEEDRIKAERGPCEWFQYLGGEACDECGRMPWEHRGRMALKKGVGPNFPGEWVEEPWPVDLLENWRMAGIPTPKDWS